MIDLTKREIECLAMAANDKTIKEISRMLFISVNTVRKHRRSILAKTACKTLLGAYKKLISDNCMPVIYSNLN